MHYIYKFLSEEQEVLYIGITGNIKSRINTQHFRSSGHLSDDCYNEAKAVIYHECVSRDDAKIRERYLINLESPKYNSKMNNSNAFGFTIDDWRWKYMPIRKPLIKRVRVERDRCLQGVAIYEQDINDVIINDFTGVFYKSLGSCSLKCVTRYPCESTAIGRVQTEWGGKDVNVVKINGRLWCFHDSIHKLLNVNSSLGTATQTVRMLQKDVIGEDDVLWISDKILIKNNIKASAYSVNGGEPLFPSKVVLIALTAVQSVMSYHIETYLESYRRALKRRGRFTVSRKTSEYTCIEKLLNDAKYAKSKSGLLDTSVPVSESIKKIVNVYN